MIEVITFSAGHPAARDSGAGAFYERLEDGPDGTPRQWYRRRLVSDYSSRRR
ncbi:hypothetical protein [Dactylosporangium darangshiense]|uniref:Uncharacterized protein n=1 Tax=Dactylosporangium darangshiense TaxID=579108 RepID=A0ABP8DIK4_9ACTN